MTEENLGISQQVLVSSVRKDDDYRPRKLPQYVAGLSASLGALAAGLVAGWSSPAGKNGAELNYSFKIDTYNFSWVASMMCLGTTAACIPAGILTNLIGRRRTMLISIILYTIGWACVIWPNSFETLVFGRFLLGMAYGVFTVTVPIYTAEIADVENRGRLGTFLELNITTGILATYTLGLFHNMFLLSLISAVVPFIFFTIFYFMPETPTYYLMKGNVNAARETLIWLRGLHYNVEPELDEKRNALAEIERNKISFLSAIQSRVTLKGIFIVFGLLIFQQLSGISVIIMYGSSIVGNVTGETSDWPIIVVGALQVIAVLLSNLVVDNWGRRITLFVSGGFMCITTLVLGVYFYLNVSNNINPEKLRWLPLVCICCFVIAYDFGYGSIPWLMVGEIFSPQVKGAAASCAASIAALTTFTITKCYIYIEREIGPHGAIWVFSGICGLNVIFTFFMVLETKGKTLERIQTELSASTK